MGIVKGFALAVGLALLTALLVIYGGLADVAASRPHGPVAGWALDTAMENAVKRNASFVVSSALLPPPSAGAGEYQEMCVMCHGAPGRPDSAIAKGLMPPPPSLARSAAHWSDSELYWIIKNGVKMTGMPAWGATHEEQELWALVSFLRILPKLTPEEYAAMAQAGGAEGEERHNH